MAVGFSETKKSILRAMYDDLLTSKIDSHYFTVTALRDILPLELAGGMIGIAIRALVTEKVLERHVSDDEGEDDLYTLTPRGIIQAEEIITNNGTLLSNYEVVPASDRIVSKTDNQEQVSAIVDRLSEIHHEISTNNESSIFLGDSKELIQSEIAAAQSLTSGKRFRLNRLIALIMPALKFLMNNFAGKALGEAAEQLIKLLFM